MPAARLSLSTKKTKGCKIFSRGIAIGEIKTGTREMPDKNEQGKTKDGSIGSLRKAKSFSALTRIKNHRKPLGPIRGGPAKSEEKGRKGRAKSTFEERPSYGIHGRAGSSTRK